MRRYRTAQSLVRMALDQVHRAQIPDDATRLDARRKAESALKRAKKHLDFLLVRSGQVDHEKEAHRVDDSPRS